ncbi:MAG: sugar-binding domain-containing protein, partial [Pyrinomonadaceae bacterium]
MISLLTLAMLLLTFADTTAAQRTVSSFDKDWLFFKGDVADGHRAELEDSSWRKLDVPHDWSIEGPFDQKNPTGGAGGFLPSGISWYRKHFNPGQDLTKRVFIEFDGVMANAEVWVNNVSLGKRPYGYSSFGYDLSDHLNFGKDNVIVVKTDTSKQPASRWYTGAGIYRHVRLVTTDGVHLEKWATFVTTPKVSAAGATVNVASKAVNAYIKARQVSFDVKLYDDRGRMVGSRSTKPSTIADKSPLEFNVDIPVVSPRLWSIETPVMYRAVVNIVSGGKVIDSETVNFGIRSFEFVPATGFWLNGTNFKIKGMCLHHDGSA